MADEGQRQVFLAKAKAAEEQAAKTRDPVSRDEWLKIAEAYRELAKTVW